MNIRVCEAKFDDTSNVESAIEDTPDNKTEAEKTLDELQELATWHLTKLERTGNCNPTVAIWGSGIPRYPLRNVF